MARESSSGTIGWLAREGGVSVETIRYYQRRSLLKTPARGAGASAAVRRYGEDDLRRLRFIRSAQAAGFTLEQIAELLELDAGHDHARARQLARERIVALDEKIAELESARTALQKLARECAVGASRPCPIITAFDSAATRS